MHSVKFSCVVASLLCVDASQQLDDLRKRRVFLANRPFCYNRHITLGDFVLRECRVEAEPIHKSDE